MKQEIAGIGNYGYGIHIREFMISAPKGIEPLIGEFARQLEEALRKIRERDLAKEEVPITLLKKTYLYNEKGILIRYSIFPVSKKDDYSGTIPIVDTSVKGGFVSYPKTLRRALSDKTREYEIKDYPYLIFIYEMNKLADEHSIFQTVLGTYSYEAYNGTGNGFFSHEKHKGVSAVMIFSSVDNDLSNLCYWLIINKEANNVVPLEDLPLAYYCFGSSGCSFTPEVIPLWEVLNGSN